MGSSFKEGLGPLVPGSHLVPYADCYRCPLGARYPTCGLGCVELARKQLKNAAAGGIAAVVVEPMQGTAGNVIPPSEFLPAVASMARELGALLVVDEMITGFGRTGRYWGHEHSGVEPDVVTIGKAFGGGFPISGILAADGVVEAKPWSNPSGSSSSYGGNPLAAAAGAAALGAIDDERLVENAREVGRAMLEALRPFEEDFPFVGQVRGEGLFLAIELVRDKATREPLAPAATRALFDACLARGLLTMAYAPRLRIQPALTIDRATAENGIDVLRQAFEHVRRTGAWERST
jgi:4-aminobutyrate aminotransferase-like enzyme